MMLNEDYTYLKNDIERLVNQNIMLKELYDFLKLAIAINGELSFRTMENLTKEKEQEFKNKYVVSPGNGKLQLFKFTENGYAIVTKQELDELFKN